MPVSPIILFFDFTSPYSYLASALVEALAARHGRSVEWVPVLLGPVFAATGARPPSQQPLKAEYMARDLARSARFLGVTYHHPQPFPVATQQAARVLLGLQRARSPLAVDWIHRVFEAYFVDGQDISAMPVLHTVGRGLRLQPEQIDAWCAEPELKERLRANGQRALVAGMCGAPYFVVDDEPFWGVDRLPQIERWLQARF